MCLPLLSSVHPTGQAPLALGGHSRRWRDPGIPVEWRFLTFSSTKESPGSSQHGDSDTLGLGLGAGSEGPEALHSSGRTGCPWGDRFWWRPGRSLLMSSVTWAPTFRIIQGSLLAEGSHSLKKGPMKTQYKDSPTSCTASVSRPPCFPAPWPIGSMGSAA